MRCGLPFTDCTSATEVTSAETAKITATKTAEAVIVAAAAATATPKAAAGEKYPAAATTTVITAGTPVAVIIAATAIVSTVAAIIAPGTPRNAGNDNEDQDDQKDPGQSSRTTGRTGFRGAVVGIFTQAQFHDGIHCPVDTLEVVPFPEGGDNDILNDGKSRSVRQKSLRAITGLNGDLALIFGNEQQNAVVVFLTADSPGSGQPVSIVKNIFPFQAIFGHYHDLGGGFVGIGAQLLPELYHLLTGQQAGKIVYQKIGWFRNLFLCQSQHGDQAQQQTG